MNYFEPQQKTQVGIELLLFQFWTLDLGMLSSNQISKAVKKK